MTSLMSSVPPAQKLAAGGPRSSLESHPSVVAVRGRSPSVDRVPLSRHAIRELALACGADDAGVVSLEHPDLAEERPFVLAALPQARALLSIAAKMHPDNLRSPRRTIANLEIHHTGHALDDVARRIAVALAERGYPSINPPMAFPMEMQDFPGRTWVVSHKRVAVAAGLGRMGLHRNVIHPRFGSSILLGTVVTSAEVRDDPPGLDFNPCIDCKLCAAACPVGAIEPDGAFRFSACIEHSYREFMTGFAGFLEEAVESEDRHDFRARVPLNEAVSMWQSLSFEPNYNSVYCLAVCPAGEDVLGSYLDRRAEFLDEVVRPLTERAETVFVVRGSDAEAHVKKRFPRKRVRAVRGTLRATSAAGLFQALPLTFQRGPARGWSAVFHFDLTGEDALRATVRIDDGKIEVASGELLGSPDLVVRADANVWLDVVDGRRNPIVALLTRRLRLSGDRSLLKRFAACFPG